jgi:hypothetical protein
MWTAHTCEHFRGTRTGGNLVTNIDLQRPAFYDDEGFNYQSYWSNRNYEHKAEVLAIRRLLKGRHFAEAADIGGGYGRLSVVLEEFADKVSSSRSRPTSLPIIPMSRSA